MLERLCMISASWREGTEALARFTLPADERDARLLAFAEQMALSELVYIATCNRIELLFVQAGPSIDNDIREQAFALLTGAQAAPGEAKKALRAWVGEGAAEHLFLVTAALDSACVGEAEIGGQVRAAFELARELGTSGPMLELLFEEANRVAAQVRSQTELGSGRVSLAEIAVDLVKQRYAEHAGNVALIGVSPMTERAAVSLTKAGIPVVVVNRSIGPARELAATHGATFMSLDEFRSAPPSVTGVISATGSPEPVLDHRFLERFAADPQRTHPALLVDMAVPPDIDPDACARYALERIGMNDIVDVAESNRDARQGEYSAAREIVDDALLKLNDRIVTDAYGPLIGTLQRRYQHTASEGVKRLLTKDLKGLGEGEQEAVRKWAEVLARRFAHIPCRGLRGLLSDGPEGSVDAFLGGLEPEFADELRASLTRQAHSERA